jgi:hypothetical protein
MVLANAAASWYGSSPPSLPVSPTSSFPSKCRCHFLKKDLLTPSAFLGIFYPLEFPFPHCTIQFAIIHSVCMIILWMSISSSSLQSSKKTGSLNSIWTASNLFIWQIFTEHMPRQIDRKNILAYSL